MQGEVFKRVRSKVFEKKRDQRELIKVAQRNFRKYLAMRDWGWFIIIQKTRGMIGQPNPEEELRLLEEKANETYGNYKDALDVTSGLEGMMGNLKDEISAMSTQLNEEQGNVSVYTDRQSKAVAIKGEAEVELVKQQNILASEEASRVELAGEVKAHAGSIGSVKKDMEDIELAITKVEQEKGNRDHTIKVLQDEVGEQDEVLNKLNKELKQNQVKIWLLLKKRLHILCKSNHSLRPLWTNWRVVLTKKRRADPTSRSKKGRLKEISRWPRIWLQT